MIIAFGIGGNVDNTMDNHDFFTLYLPALEEALNNDEKNFGFLVKGPDYYIDNMYINDIYMFIDRNTDYFNIFNMAGFYFDAKSHNFPDVGVLTTLQYKEILKKEMFRLKSIYISKS